jgi:hypothetical protein
MKPVKRNKRNAFHNGPSVAVVSMKELRNDEGHDLDSTLDSLSGDSYTEDGSMKFVGDQAPDASEVEELSSTRMSDEEIKIKALGLAINMAKLMSEVTVNDVLKMANDVAAYLRKED